MTPAGAKALRALPRLKVLYVPAPPEDEGAEAELKQFRRALPGVEVRPMYKEMEEGAAPDEKN
jgi:hypothetical protein